MPIPMSSPALACRRLAGALLLCGVSLATLPNLAQAEDEAAFLQQSAAFFEQQSKTNLPMQVDQVTRLEKVELDTQSKVLHYHYGISSMKADGLDAAALDKFRSEQRARLERGTCQQPQLLQNIRQHNIRVAHDYDGSDGKPLASIEIDPQKLQCQG